LKTIKATGPLLYRVDTDKHPDCPKGKVLVHCVRYETYEIDSADFNEMKFKIHDANTEEAKAIAALVKL